GPSQPRGELVGGGAAGIGILAVRGGGVGSQFWRIQRIAFGEHSCRAVHHRRGARGKPVRSGHDLHQGGFVGGVQVHLVELVQEGSGSGGGCQVVLRPESDELTELLEGYIPRRKRRV